MWCVVLYHCEKMKDPKVSLANLNAQPDAQVGPWLRETSQVGPRLLSRQETGRCYTEQWAPNASLLADSVDRRLRQARGPGPVLGRKEGGHGHGAVHTPRALPNE